MSRKITIGILLLAAVMIWVFAPGDIAGVFVVIAIAAIALSSTRFFKQAMRIVTSSTDNKFLATLEGWFRSQSEILLLIRYSHAGGNKSFEFFSSFATLSARLCQLPPRTSIVAFRQRQLPLRGIVDDTFIGRCLSSIDDGTQFLLVETAQTTAGAASWFHEESGESHKELHEALDGSREKPVAVGIYPPWREDGSNVISAVVPDESGVVKPGIY